MAEYIQPLRAVFVIRYFHPFIGGLEKKVFNLAGALSRQGIRITVVTSRFSLSWEKRAFLQGFEVIRLPSPPIKFAGAIVYMASLFLYLARNSRRFDLCHAFQIGYSSACAISAGRLLEMKTVLTLSSSGSGGDVQRHRRSPWGRLFLRCCLKASRIIALQERMREEIAELGPSGPVKIIPNGIDASLYRPAGDRAKARRNLGLAGQERVLLYAGRLSAEKGVDFLLESFGAIRTGLPLRLWIYGAGPERPALERLARQLGIEAAVTFHEATDAIVSAYQAADIFIMPSRFEGMSNAVLEAMACGLPVIATGVTGNRDLIEHGASGLLVPFGDPAALAGAIASVLDNAELARRLADGGRRAAGSHSLEKAAALHAMMYAEMTGGERP